MKNVSNEKSFIKILLPLRGCLMFFCLFLVCSSLNIFAVNLAEYREKVRYAAGFAEKLIYFDGEENLSPAEYSKIKREIFINLRQILPPSERVEWKGTSFETNNQWLHDKLNEFEKEAESSPKRVNILTEIRERLLAIKENINRLENPNQNAANQTKDADKQKLNEILQREEYQKPEVKESFFQRLIKKISEWLGKNIPRPKIPEGSSSNFQSISLTLQILLYAFIFTGAAFLIYRFAPHFIKRFQNRNSDKKKDRIILGERIAKNESAASLFSDAERLAAEGDLRGAIRKGYIALLCELSDRKIIGLSKHKTNRDYLRDVRKKRELYENMNGLTLNYERHWYGAETAEKDDWEEFKNGYRQAVKAKA